MKKIGIIVGSNRTKSVTKRLAEWVSSQLSRGDVQAEIVDLVEVDLPWLDEPELPSARNYQYESTKQWSQQIQGYDGIVFISPQYNWGYPAVLKNAVDTLYEEWQNKPVATIFFGGHGGFQAELAFSLVLQGLKVKRLPTNLSWQLPLGQIDAEMTDKQVAIIMAKFQSEVDLLWSTLS
ncbi:NADPH-dependent FMN reductase [Fructobacillus ficulneus]|uniref:NADPH-dependent FMN reductase n=1 Tax=Fructobacillus ficulneus TaxID=157463 RepID=A0A0K8MGB6_9LACO|nr:NAD(P)H-dependent oxidoreductase [Fructobacillus ficulneus]GAO99243.1 NADPH-dependent FMN reductase [Fructobacillus ficulneus]